MHNYRLTIRRSVTLVTRIDMEGDSESDAIARFQHQLESRSCSAIEDDELWGDAIYYQVFKGDGPYSGEYAVMDVELDD
jgi:hypothetical protein